MGGGGGGGGGGVGSCFMFYSSHCYSYRKCLVMQFVQCVCIGRDGDQGPGSE